MIREMRSYTLKVIKMVVQEEEFILLEDENILVN